MPKKLKIEIINLSISEILSWPKKHEPEELNFTQIWEKYIKPLEGKILTRINGRGENKITKVDWGGIERITSNEHKSKIKIEIFELSVNTLLTLGHITRNQINENYSGRASSGVILILSQVPFFSLEQSPLALPYNKITEFENFSNIEGENEDHETTNSRLRH